ncbi:hypothetical protein PUNSTDRAFT_47128 [Punctularia strigosozonata HHB-11173 SS5]|uniref:Velvet domain-containing protein n=1 Tax=Punctularia strigosozonata (strain HHB-11173) TaxID=741275 RepID=R7S5P9_PUNST|nr:uncharacterized protein PUNSTDRAFT_47128 [Punctularia strigosozonata HHB-11173 SS5]EIN04846.1 hypothetical protein PUNSTDRAFT_47128 [Punctularia strigosozonata HHB-11173 SS5]
MSTVSHTSYFATGRFVGRTIRAELSEIQGAVRGRKERTKQVRNQGSARHRPSEAARPLLPCKRRNRTLTGFVCPVSTSKPPVVQLRLFEVFAFGTAQHSERELADGEYREFQTLGLICRADLFRFVRVEEESNNDGLVLPSGAMAASSSSASSSSEPTGADAFDGAARPPGDFHQAMQPSTVASGPGTTIFISDATAQPESVGKEKKASAPSDRSATCPVVGGWGRIDESRSMASELFGERSTQATVVHHGGRYMIVFAFSDLSIRQTGEFVLRYSAFDIHSTAVRVELDSSIDPALQAWQPGVVASASASSSTIPVLAECYSQKTIRIWDTKSFPGLEKSTALTQAIARQSNGVRPRVRRHSEMDERSGVMRVTQNSDTALVDFRTGCINVTARYGDSISESSKQRKD